MSAVFASADGDGDVLDQTLAALASPSPSLSPTLFHNSVFNAPVGYWSIATRSTGWATMICGGEGSVAAALLEAASQADGLGGAVLCVCVDLGYPDAPRGASRSGPLVRVRHRARSEAGRDRGLGDRSRSTRRRSRRMAVPTQDAWSARFAGNAAAAAIPLLARVARRESGRVLLPGPDGQVLGVRVVAP